MFHHFYDDKHSPGQGSINQEEFYKILVWLKENYNLIGANEYFDKCISKRISDQDICLSFDDGLKCQFDIACPILEDLNLDSFFFIHTGRFDGTKDMLEIYRYFRNNYFDSIEDFYNSFFKEVSATNILSIENEKRKFLKSDYLAEYSFYTFNDRFFRFLRDRCFSVAEYAQIMMLMIKRFEINLGLLTNKLYMSEADIKSLSKKNIIGLHSHNHPTDISELNKKEQLLEYQNNKKILTNFMKGEILTMSHPCGCYNEDTISILSSLGIKVGFRDNMLNIPKRSLLEIPREDHVNILKKMKAK
tara:strand:- start:16593 stop:17501 length:909 start_codon:yes stop_codon:yes gene_type:complete